MQSSTLRLNLGAAIRIAIVAVVFVFALSTSLAIGASTAEAQSRRAAAQLVDVPAPDVADPRAPQAPFGYGGGPRAPRDTVGLGDIFDRFREFVLRLFR